jgi:hypothetical protein
MNPQLALLMALLSGNMGGGGMGSQLPQQGQQGMDVGAGNSDILNALRGPSPVNSNPNYGSTVSRFFDQSPLAGAQPYQGSGPLQAGTAGNNAVRGGSGHSSFLPTDFNSSMQKWVGP